MFERSNTPEEIFSYKLGSALSMERQLVDLLEPREQCTLREEIRHPLAVNRAETLQHIANIEQCFTLLDEPVDDAPCGVIEALASESKTMIKKSDDSLPDVLILAATSEAEHYEIAVYETLIANADARRGATAVAKLLRENLAQDKHALTTVRAPMKTILDQGYRRECQPIAVPRWRAPGRERRYEMLQTLRAAQTQRNAFTVN